ncbi:MAG: gamma-glutamyl-gamma-aminobutyrate hydrolase family protein [Myxococcales bacterium]
MRARPVVGLTPDQGKTAERPGRPSMPRYELKEAYAEAVLAAGGLPIVLPYSEDDAAAREAVALCDALVVTGGAFDIPPEAYGAAAHRLLGEMKPHRTQYERRVLRYALESRKPVLGVCGGMQLMAVELGGTLYQDIRTQCPEKNDHRVEAKYEHHFHDVRILPGTWLSELYPGGELKHCNSIHHQAVKTLGEGLVVEAMSEPDGLVEAIRWEGHCFVVGVQWHPEFMEPGDPKLVQSRPLLEAFVKACEQRKKTGKATPLMAARAA